MTLSIRAKVFNDEPVNLLKAVFKIFEEVWFVTDNIA